MVQMGKNGWSLTAWMAIISWRLLEYEELLYRMSMVNTIKLEGFKAACSDCDDDVVVKYDY